MTAYEIYKEINKADQPECYEIAIQNNIGNIDGACKIIQDCFECDKETAEEVIKIMNKEVEDGLRSKGIEPLTREQMAYNNMIAKELLNKPKCPICGSKNLSKYKSFEKALKMAAFGIFGMGDIGKTYMCNNCGSKF